MGSFKILTDDELVQRLADLPDWEIHDGGLKAAFVFPDFRSAIAFICLVAIESEVMNHHPTWSNAYRRVELSLSTHDAGDRITDLDIHLARHISQCAQKFLS